MRFNDFLALDLLENSAETVGKRWVKEAVDELEMAREESASIVDRLKIAGGLSILAREFFVFSYNPCMSIFVRISSELGHTSPAGTLT